MHDLLVNQTIRRRPRRRRRFRLFWRRAGLFAAMALLGGGIVFGMARSETFALRHIEVVGRLEQTGRSDILAAAGIDDSAHLFSLHLGELEKRIAALAWIRQVTLRRQVPDTLWIHVVEEKPKALLLDDRLYFVSGQGEVFKAVDGETNRDWPVLTGMKTTQNLAEVLRLIDFFEQNHDLGIFGLSEIHYNDAIGFSVVTLKGPVEVRLGRGNFESKLRRLPRVWTALARHRPRGIDFNYEDKVVVKL